MKKRVIKKAERMMLVDKLCELQTQIDEYERFLGDLFIMLHKREPQVVIEHQCSDFAGMLWNDTLELIRENETLKAQLEAQNLNEK